MAKSIFSTKEQIDDLTQKNKMIDYQTAKLAFVESNFPGVKVRSNGNFEIKRCYSFNSKLVNSNYTDFEIYSNPYACSISVFNDIPFVYNNEEEIIRVYSIPQTSSLASLRNEHEPFPPWKLKKSYIEFAKFSINMKSNKFADELINACRVELMKFVQIHPGCEINTTKLEPRLKKLLSFI